MPLFLQFFGASIGVMHDRIPREERLVHVASPAVFAVGAERPPVVLHISGFFPFS